MRKISRFIKNPEVLGLFLFGLFHCVAAYFSFGFHHPDEHFQILEFANYWVGLVPDSSGLPWEFHAQIRPWFQPMIHGLFMKLAILARVYNPFSMAFFFRLLYAALNIHAMWLLWQEFKKRYVLHPLWFLWTSILWFLPYLHVRTSSENLAGILVTYAFVGFLRNRRLFWIGLLLGFSFLARYQMALGVFGLGLYVLYRDRKITRENLGLGWGFLIPVALGVILDRIGYGNWVFTPYEYFKVNLIDGKAATFNPYPWYQYFIWVLQLNPLVSIPLFLGAVFYVNRKRVNGLAWFVVTYLFLHLFITNKEYRFLFPVLNLIPFMAMVGFQEMGKWILSKRTFVAYALINGIGFAVSTLHGASVETLWCVHVANRYALPGETWLSNRDYLDQFSKGYYRLPDHHVIIYHDGSELERELTQTPKSKVLLDGKLEDQATQSALQVIEQHGCALITSARPNFIFKLKKQFPAVERLTFKALYQCGS